jgi:hypothetical protein
MPVPIAELVTQSARRGAFNDREVHRFHVGGSQVFGHAVCRGISVLR